MFIGAFKEQASTKSTKAFSIQSSTKFLQKKEKTCQRMLRWAATPMEWRTLFVIKLECQCVVDPWAFRALRTNTSC